MDARTGTSPGETPVPDSARLSDKKMWQGMYSGQRDTRYWPHPEKRCSAFELERIYKKELPQRRGTKILEMGCGGSKWLPYFFKEFGYEIHGIDYAEEGCERARINLAKVGGTGTISCRDFLKLGDEFRGGYDVVLSYGVVEHFAKTEDIIQIFADCLRPGGIVVTYVPNFSGIMGRFLKRMHRSLYDTHKLFSLGDLASYHDSCGLTNIYSSYLEFADFSVLPFEGFSDLTQKVLKNLIYVFNRTKLICYRRWGSNPQSPFWCAAMIVLARKPEPARIGAPQECPRPRSTEF